MGIDHGVIVNLLHGYINEPAAGCGGDTVCVWKLDRLGRSVKEILTLADDLHDRGIGPR